MPVFTTAGMEETFRSKTSEYSSLTCLGGDYDQFARSQSLIVFLITIISLSFQVFQQPYGPVCLESHHIPVSPEPGQERQGRHHLRVHNGHGLEVRTDPWDRMLNFSLFCFESVKVCLSPPTVSAVVLGQFRLLKRPISWGFISLEVDTFIKLKLQVHGRNPKRKHLPHPFQ